MRNYPKYLRVVSSEEDLSAIAKVVDSSGLRNGPKAVLKALIENRNKQPVSLRTYYQPGYHVAWNELINTYFRTHDMAYRLRKIGTDKFQLFVVAIGKTGARRRDLKMSSSDSAKVVAKAFISIKVLIFDEEENNANLPEAIWKIVRPHVYSYPSIIYLPWPPEFIPSAGDTISMEGMPVHFEDDLMVREVCYRYQQTTGVRAIIFADTWEKHLFDMQALLTAAEQGFLFESKTPIKDVLEEAGVLSTWAEYSQSISK